MPTRLVGSLLLAVLISVTGCGGPSDSATVEPTLPPWNYPTEVFRTEIVVPLDEHTSAGAEFAMQFEIDAAPATSDPELAQSILTRGSPEIAEPAWQNVTRPDQLHTGGELFRTVAAMPADANGTIEFSICQYYSPGLYSRNPDTGLPQPSFGYATTPYTILHPRVRFTTEPAADGSVPSEPRWLVVGYGKRFYYESDEPVVRSTCGPYAPDPFVQTTPVPVSGTP